MSLETSGAFGGLSEQATVKKPAASATNKTAMLVSDFIVLLFYRSSLIDQSLAIKALSIQSSTEPHRLLRCQPVYAANNRLDPVWPCRIPSNGVGKKDEEQTMRGGQGRLPGRSNCKGPARAAVCSHSL